MNPKNFASPALFYDFHSNRTQSSCSLVRHAKAVSESQLQLGKAKVRAGYETKAQLKKHAHDWKTTGSIKKRIAIRFCFARLKLDGKHNRTGLLYSILQGRNDYRRAKEKG